MREIADCRMKRKARSAGGSTAGIRRSVLLGPVLLAVLAGCAGGIDLREAAVDPTIKTGSIGTPQTGQAGDETLLSDQSTIRNAVSSADPEALGEAGLAWANARTGSRGSDDALVESTRRGLLVPSLHHLARELRRHQALL
jgi:hypothetical protein